MSTPAHTEEFSEGSNRSCSRHDEGGASAVILMYHEVTDQANVAEMLKLTSCVLDTAAFVQEMRWLVENRLDVGPISHARGPILKTSPCRTQSPRVILTFDDGYVGNYDSAFPVLLEHGLVGTFFITTGLVGRNRMMSWNQIREMSDHGMHIGSHTVNHRLLGRLNRHEVAYELEHSKKFIEDKIGKRVDYLSVPYGSLSRWYRPAAEKAEYLGGATSLPGINTASTDPFFLRRMQIPTQASLSYFVSLCRMQRLVFLRRKLRHCMSSMAKKLLGESRYLRLYQRIHGTDDFATEQCGATAMAT